MVLKLEVCFLIYQKLRTKYRMKVWYSNLTKTEFRENLLRLIECFQKTVSKELFLMLKHHSGLTPLLVSLKDPFSVHCFSWYISMIYHMTYSPILNYLQMILLFFSCARQKYFSKMIFNSDPFKQAQEVIFSRKSTKTNINF